MQQGSLEGRHKQQIAFAMQARAHERASGCVQKGLVQKDLRAHRWGR